MYDSTENIKKWLKGSLILISFVLIILWLVSGQGPPYEPLLVLLGLIGTVLATK